tara:strand:- start:1 stop:390 length:390 start_codon:yes stop_codon:yes gene_type:complete
MKKITRVYFNILAVLSIICQPLFAQYPQVGDNFQGGIVFYVDTTGGQLSGLVAPPTNMPVTEQWGCMGTSISGADGTAIGTGSQNIIDIEAGCATSGTAADICANYTDGTYSESNPQPMCEEGGKEVTT